MPVKPSKHAVTKSHTHLFRTVEASLLHQPLDIFKLFIWFPGSRFEDECPITEVVCVEENGRAANTHELSDNPETVAAGRDGVWMHNDGIFLDDLSVDAFWQVFF